MEDPGSSSVESVTSPAAGAPKSKLDTLPKDDLIKFAKKQMAAMQKMKGRCADLEKEVESLKQQSKQNNSSSADSILVQELTERMDALLLEKAESQQSLALSRKDLERTKQQAKDELAILQDALDRSIDEHQKRINYLESSIEESNNKHQEEVAFFQNLLKEREESDRQKENECERKVLADHASVKDSLEEVKRSLEVELESLRAELEAIQVQKSQEITELHESHQQELTKAQQEVENLREELAQKSLQHEEEVRALEEDFEIERERLLFLHEELTEQLALKDSYLQDVQEEDEEPARGSGIARMLELSRCPQSDSNQSIGDETETSRLKVVLEDLRAQNTMLQDELTLLSNVKGELEAELERAKEEFQMERDELEFKINELQLNRENINTHSDTNVSDLNVDPGQQEDTKVCQQQREECMHGHNAVPCNSKEELSPLFNIPDQNSFCPDEQQQMIQELRVSCEVLTKERDSAIAECHHMRDILQGLELELGQKTQDFVLQYKAMKEQGDNTLLELQIKIEEVSQERDRLVTKLSDVTEEKNCLMEDIQDLKVKMEAFTVEDQKINLQPDMKEQTTLLKESLEGLTRQNEEVLSELQMKESMIQDLQEMVNNLTEERNEMQSHFSLEKEEIRRLDEEREKDIHRLQEEKENTLDLLQAEKLLNTKREKLEEKLTQELERRQETVSSLEATIRDPSTENANLQHKLEDAFSEISQAHKEKELSDSKMKDLASQLAHEVFEKHRLEGTLASVREEAEQAQAIIRTLEENQSDVLRNATKEASALQAHVDGLEKERFLLRSSLKESQEGRLEDVEIDLQAYIEDLKKERNILKDDLEGSVRKSEGLLKDLEDMKIVNEDFVTENQQLQAQVSLLTKATEEKELQVKENVTEELKEMLNALTEERDQLKLLFQLQGEEMQKLNIERERDIQRLHEEKENADLLSEQKEMALNSFRREKEDEVQRLNELRETIEDKLKEELGQMKETISSLELTIKDLSVENSNLQLKLQDAFCGTAQGQEEKELLGSNLAALTAQLQHEMSEKNQLEAKLKSLTEEAERTQVTIRSLEENLSEVLRNSTKEAEELQARVDELEKENKLLRSSLEEAQGERRLEEVQIDFQAHIKDLEKEKNILKDNLEGVLRDSEGLQKDLEDMKIANVKIIAENQQLQAQLSLLIEGTEEKEREGLKSDGDIAETERREFSQQLTEKDSIISQLRSELAALQEATSQSALSEDNAAKEFTEKIALLEKESKEKDEKMNKIKAVAVKAKKEMDASKKEVATLKEEVESLKAEREKLNSSMKDIIHVAEGYKHLQIDYDKQMEQLDKEKEKVEAAERQIAELTKRLGAAVTQKDMLGSEKEDLLAGMETMRSTVKQLEAQSQEQQKHSANLDRDLLVERTMKEQKIKELLSAVKEVEELTAQLHKQQQQSQQMAQELDQLRKEAQQSSLLGMEMADYERLVKELNAKLSERDVCAEELKSQILINTQKEEALKQEIEALKSQIDQGEEKASKMKQLLVNTKKDLADVKKQESSLMMQQASLRGELEANQQQLESSKIQICELTAERHHLQEQLRSALEQQQRTSSSLQQRINSLQQQCDAAKAEVVATTGEFESYKVRVHNVLKQQKNKTNGQSEGDSSKIERDQLCSQVAHLKSRLVESQQSLQSSTAELHQLQTEHDTLLERHNRMLQEAISKDAELRERLLSLQSEKVALQSELTQAQADLCSQTDAQRQTFREQLRKLQDEHRATVDTLQGQMTKVEEQLFILQNQNSSMSMQSGRKSVTSDTQRKNTDRNQAGLGLLVLSDLQSMAREEGEGMETNDTDSPSPALTPLPSLEKLLTSPNPKQEPFVWTVEPTKEELSQKLSTATRSMEHMNGILHETEATNAALMEQITLLKSEVRRLERNQEREKGVANLEYLKNVLLQFIFLRSGSERRALLPVIHTMLQLSPEEKSKLAAIAQGEEESSSPRGSGWTSYLHSWSGIR
ncbi:GRIP and coiled-coil domain-containing protein 2 isoform X2 [Thalassophryne amazonica]|uniref:GRIP and coiled-coil domain-containing protein 2 isoform X2 n=1 Tax=Thalassophryne amazonica TaxID=390379 RepID=UPI0014721CA2|nr:GRIP and coiled-coil domain-containing protein 2 isoform X2 [Thalassophryne amazonica]